MQRMPPANDVRMLLKSLEKLFPGFHRDSDARAMALIAIAQALGSVVTWTLHREGEKRAERALRMVYAMAFDTACKGDAMLRDREEESRGEV